MLLFLLAVVDRIYIFYIYIYTYIHTHKACTIRELMCVNKQLLAVLVASTGLFALEDLLIRALTAWVEESRSCVKRHRYQLTETQSAIMFFCLPTREHPIRSGLTK